MGSGCSAVKETSDVILVNDDFEATIKSIMWGRNIYNNISRFLQFQVTVNFSALLTIVIGSMIMAESPLSAVQLLWINLIMDTFAAFALATESPSPNVLQDQPWKEEINVMSTDVWGQIVGMSLYNTIMMVLVIVLGPVTSDLTYSFTDNPAKDTDGGIAKAKHMTLIFNSFVFLQIFNQYNCRRNRLNEFNVIEGMFNNLIFVLVSVGTFFIQFAMVYYIPIIVRAHSISKSEWGSCIVLGATALLAGPLVKKLLTLFGSQKLAFMYKFFDENKEVKNNKLLDAYDAVAAVEIGSEVAKQLGKDEFTKV